MTFTILTYNLLYNKAISRLSEIINDYSPDIICLQEIDTENIHNNPIIKLNYQLANYAHCFVSANKIYGVATFYKPTIFRLLRSKPIPLSRSVYEIFTLILHFFNRRPRQTVLKNIFIEKNTNTKIVIYNTHLSAISLNRLRLKQLASIDFNGLDKQIPTIICGDFNFPVERKKLEKIMHQYNLKEATTSIDYTLVYPSQKKDSHYGWLPYLITKLIKFFYTDKLKLDYIFYRGLKHLNTKRLNIRLSDHYPLIAQFKVKSEYE